MIIVPAYAIFFGLFFIVLSAKTIMARRSAGVAIGTGRNKQLERAVRVHANFAEYVPLTLLLISFAEQRGAHHQMIHFLCMLFLVSRVLHAWGVSQENENFRFRVIAMMMTFATLFISSTTIGYSYFY